MFMPVLEKDQLKSEGRCHATLDNRFILPNVGGHMAIKRKVLLEILFSMALNLPITCICGLRGNLGTIAWEEAGRGEF
jgi:hypothetical protein